MFYMAVSRYFLVYPSCIITSNNIQRSNMLSKSFILSFLSLSFVFSLHAQTPPKSDIEKFFTIYESGDTEKAVDFIYSSNPWIDRIKDDLESLKSKLINTRSLVGNYYGYDLLVTKRLANSYVLYSYFVRHDRQAIRFIFQFYKADKKWVLYSFAFDDSWDEEVKESAKFYNLKEMYSE
jgi:hypothetical protein